MKILHRLNGFTAVGVLIGLIILAVIGTPIVTLVATNQSSRTKSFYQAQAFDSAHAGLEFAMRQIISEGNPNPLPIRYFRGQLLDFERTCQKIKITGTYGSASNTLSINDPGQLCAVDGSSTPTANSAPFNGTSISQNRYIWFSASLKANGINSSSITKIYTQSSNVLFTANGVNYNVVVPGSIVTFDPNATCTSTTYGASLWHTTAPTSEKGSVFVSGIGFLVPANLPGSISPVTWNTIFASDQYAVGLTWKWGAAVYTTSLSNLNGLGVKASDKDTCNDSSNDKVATPKNVISYHVAGARAGGGADYVGDGTGTSGAVASCIISNC